VGGPPGPGVKRRALWASIAVALAGCGSSSSGGSHPARSGPHAATPAPNAPNGEASRAPAQIIQDTVAALDRVHSFHLQGYQSGSGPPTFLSADISIPGRLRVTLSQGRGIAQIIAINGQGYLRANLAFYSGRAGANPRVAALLADRWISEPATTTPGASIFDALTSAATVGHCLVDSHNGRLSVTGTGTIRGRPVVVITDHGGPPGTAPGRLYVTTTGPPLPLLGLQTAAGRPGGTPDRECNETPSDVSTHSTSGRFAVSAYNRPVSISAPAGALDLSTLSPGTQV
jgi:hypothetical protein